MCSSVCDLTLPGIVQLVVTELVVVLAPVLAGPSRIFFYQAVGPAFPTLVEFCFLMLSTFGFMFFFSRRSPQ